MHTTQEVTLFLMLVIAVAALPLVGSAGLALGRMQATDEIDRDESRTYTRRDGRVLRPDADQETHQ